MFTHREQSDQGVYLAETVESGDPDAAVGME